MLPEDTEQVVAIYIPTRNLTAIFFWGGEKNNLYKAKYTDES